MNVFVKNRNGNPLMPCKPAKARKLLRDRKAKVVSRCPFTIQLNWDCEENVQPVTLGIDKGSHVTGFSCVGNQQVLISGEIHHRLDIKKTMQTRAHNRRQRRSRKWYRPPRFDNRGCSKRSGRLPVSIKANVSEVVRVVQRLPLPIGEIVVEDVQVDIARLNNEELVGRADQQSNRLDENLRIATLMRDEYQCKNCGKKNRRLEAHHIVYTEHGGKDTISNLMTLCKPCHQKVHQGKLSLDGLGDSPRAQTTSRRSGTISGFFDRIAQRTMQGKTYLYEKLGKIAKLSTVFGYQTSAYRKSLDLPKTHSIDALCVATLQKEEAIKPSRANFYTVKFRPRQTRRVYYDLARKGKGRVRYQVNGELEGFRKGDIVRVKGKWVKQIFSIYSTGYLAFARVKGEPSSAKPVACQLLQRGQTIIWQQAA